MKLSLFYYDCYWNSAMDVTPTFNGQEKERSTVYGQGHRFQCYAAKDEAWRLAMEILPTVAHHETMILNNTGS